MGKYDKLLLKILSGKSDFNIDFEEFCNLLRQFGFKETVKGSHRVFRKPGFEERINIQPENGKAKGYQVRQIRELIVRYGLGE